MAQLGRFDYTVQTTLGLAVSGASVAVYREGATVNGNQSGVSPLAVTVRHAGKIVTGDTVFINATTGVTYAATRTSSTVITLSGFGGTLNVSGGDRLTPSGTQPTLYGDDQAGASTANPLTSGSTGRANCWIEYGAYDIVVSGGGTTPTAFTSQVMPIETQASGMVNVKAFGAKGDNSTDDSTAINAAITEAAETRFGGIGTVVYFPPGTYILGSQVVVKNKVRLVGSGRSSTVLKASGGVAPATGLVRLGDGTGIVFGCRVENMTIDCNDVAASIGVYSTEANEQSGVYHCVVQNFRTNGIKFSGASCQNAFVDNSEVYGSASGATSGIYLTGTAGIIHLRYLTVSGNSGSPMTSCIDNEDNIAAFGIHGEYATNLILFDTNNSIGIASNIFGHSSITSCVNINAGASNGIIIGPVYTNGATNAVLDNRSSRTITSSNMALYVLGDGAGAAAQVFGSVGALNAGSWFINSAVGGTVRSFVDLDTTPSVGIGNVFKAINTGATNITTFDDGVQGQCITVIFTTVNTTLVNSATFRMNGAANITPTANDVIQFVYDGGTWFMSSPISAT